MTDFFSVNKIVGRPSRTSSNAGRPTGAEKRPAQALAAPPAEAPVDKPKKLKLTRAYWSKGEGLKKMTDAIADWEPELQKPGTAEASGAAAPPVLSVECQRCATQRAS